jgi:hypothetical protein
MKRLVVALCGLSAVLMVLALSSVSASAISASPATSTATAAAHGHSAVATSGYRALAAIPSFPSQCSLNEWCLFTGINFTGTNCGGQNNPVNLSGPCRNGDESVADHDTLCGAPPNDTCALRLYYHPFNIDNGGAHTCIDYGKFISNLDNSAYKFNSNTGQGFGQTVWRNVGGVNLSHSACANPIAPGL